MQAESVWLGPLRGPVRLGMADVKGRMHVGPHQQVERLGGKVLERGAVLHPGIVDQDVERRLGVKSVDGGAHGRPVGLVEGQRVHPVAFGAQPLGRSPQPVGVARIQHHLRAGLGQPARKRQPDAHRRAGDKRGAPGQIEQVHVSPPGPFAPAPFVLRAGSGPPKWYAILVVLHPVPPDGGRARGGRRRPMKALVAHGPRDLRLETVAPGRPGPGRDAHRAGARRDLRIGPA
ncbi:hypothetical protein SAMN05878426_106146 [Phaeovulum vinaykumarii]|uniref:Uncharacterized protein n=1 Tax=Phaeovulum vinaykumarii TaxID=407234 RepID=A0A1N7M8B6_9RHOB|nr:hypothetical protein SAMN05421795_10644 [Phaeovulum vinaykumarii]SOC11089.1 hypothetical protein SAMN05878426_106146 [Phaeovulum vinaykumarii]